MTRRTKRTFTKQFRADAVKLFLEGSATLTEVSRHLGVHPSVLSSWVRKAEAPKVALGAPERGEFERMRRELEQVRMERDFLKKAAAFFAKENK